MFLPFVWTVMQLVLLSLCKAFKDPSFVALLDISSYSLMSGVKLFFCSSKCRSRKIRTNIPFINFLLFHSSGRVVSETLLSVIHQPPRSHCVPCHLCTISYFSMAFDTWLSDKWYTLHLEHKELFRKLRFL